MKFNENLYYYKGYKNFRRGGFGADIFIVKGDNAEMGGNHEETAFFMVDTGTAAGNKGNKNILKMKQDNIHIKKVNGIFFTHSHPDHIAGTKFYLSRIGKHVPLYFNAQYRYRLEDPALVKKELRAAMGIYHDEITRLPNQIIDLGFKLLWGKRHPLTNIQPIKERDRVYLNSEIAEKGFVTDSAPNEENEDIRNIIEIFNAPGHTTDHMAYLIKCSDGRNVLLSGDVISFKNKNKEAENLSSSSGSALSNIEGESYSNGVSEDLIPLASLNNPVSDYLMEINTLDKLSKLDIDVLFTSHYGFFEGKNIIKKYLIEAKNTAISFKDKIIKELEDKPMRIRELAETVIDMEEYLSGYSTKTSTIFVILRYLMEQGIVAAKKNKDKSFLFYLI
ncbi:MAG: MBL fold metallo-hydrolase [Promethearchaeota archaeon]